MPRFSKTDYDVIRQETEKPFKQRKKVLHPITGKMVVPRRYHLQSQELDQMWNSYKKTEKFPNPYSRHGIYWGFVEALIELGENSWWDFPKVKHRIEKCMSEVKRNEKSAWEEFVSKKSKNYLCAKDLNGRIMETARMLQRVKGRNPYGEKLRQLKACVDITFNSMGLPFYRLNTSFVDYNDVEPYRKSRRRKR